MSRQCAVTPLAPPWRFADRCIEPDVCEAHLVLEGSAARLAAARMESVAAALLADAVDALSTALESDDVDGTEADAHLNVLVVGLAANPVPAGTIGPMRDMMVEK